MNRHGQVSTCSPYIDKTKTSSPTCRDTSQCTKLRVCRVYWWYLFIRTIKAIRISPLTHCRISPDFLLTIALKYATGALLRSTASYHHKFGETASTTAKSTEKLLRKTPQRRFEIYFVAAVLESYIPARVPQLAIEPESPCDSSWKMMLHQLQVNSACPVAASVVPAWVPLHFSR